MRARAVKVKMRVGAAKAEVEMVAAGKVAAGKVAETMVVGGEAGGGEAGGRAELVKAEAGRRWRRWWEPCWEQGVSIPEPTGRQRQFKEEWRWQGYMKATLGGSGEDEDCSGSPSSRRSGKSVRVAATLMAHRSANLKVRAWLGGRQLVEVWRRQRRG